MTPCARFVQIIAAFAVLPILPLRAQDAEVPHTRTLLCVEAPAFPYAAPGQVGLSTEKLDVLSDESARGYIPTYMSMGAIVDNASGVPIGTFILRRILQPIGLEDTQYSFSPDAPLAARMNSRYAWNAEAGTFECFSTPVAD